MSTIRNKYNILRLFRMLPTISKNDTYALPMLMVLSLEYIPRKNKNKNDVISS